MTGFRCTTIFWRTGLFLACLLAGLKPAQAVYVDHNMPGYHAAVLISRGAHDLVVQICSIHSSSLFWYRTILFFIIYPLLTLENTNDKFEHLPRQIYMYTIEISSGMLTSG